ncbi:MAG: PAS domain S-box protein [Desulfobacteraceae bacterium]|nr:PAS domain S-box protein [Desulfobacteraceae bacterium]
MAEKPIREILEKKIQELEQKNSEYKQAEQWKLLNIKILDQINKSEAWKECIEEILNEIKQFTGFHAVAIRLNESEDFPYYITKGFPDHFVEAEKYLCTRDSMGEIKRDSNGNPYVECMCGNIICGRTDDSKDFFTKGGSFWSNNTSKLLSETTDEDRQARTRNRCNSEGYESVGLFPLKAGYEILGLLQINDMRRHQFTENSINFFEDIGVSIGTAFSRKRAQINLKVSEENLRSIFENIQDIYYKVDQKGKVLAASPSALKLYGYKSLDEIIGMHDYDFVYNMDDNALFSKELQKKGSVRNYIIKHKHKNGAPIYVETNTNVFFDDQGRPAGATGVFRDVTDRLKAEKRQQEHIKFLKSLGTIDKVIHQSTNLNTMLQNIAETIMQLFKCDRAWLLYPCDPDSPFFKVPVEKTHSKYPGAKTLNLKVPMSDPMKSDMIKALSANGPVTFGPGNQEPVSSDTYKEFNVQSQIFMSIHPKTGNPWLFGMHQCAFERVWTDNEIQLFKEIGRRLTDSLSSLLFLQNLQESEAKYRSIMSSMDEAAYICSSDARIEYMNPAMIKKVGFDATGETCYKVLYGLDEKCPWCVMEKVINGQSQSFEIVSPKDNRTYNISNSPIFHADGSISKFSILHDITDIKKMETRLQQAQKLEAVAVLAGGIAHDFNNILFPIIGLTEMLLEKDQTKRNKTDLKTILTAGKRAKELVSQILTFSRKHQHEMQPLKLQPLLKETIKLSRSTIPSNIKIKQNIDKRCGPVMADALQIHQVIMNLITNAYQAMEGSEGVLSICLKQEDPDVSVIELQKDRKQQYVCIEIKDTGIGMDKKILGDIFQPYFSTKAHNKGSGLGLAVSHGIVTTFGGSIDVKSEPGKGACFSIYLPITDKKIIKDNPPAYKKIQGHSKKVLIVDDESNIINLLNKILLKSGFQVEGFIDSVQALEKFKSFPENYDLIISDLTMPNLMGDKFCSKVREINSKIPIILLTGYNESKIMDRQASSGIDRVLTKPVEKNHILTVISELIK